MYTRRQFIADTLKAAAPDAEWDAAGVDRSLELADILMRAGLPDLGKLQLQRVEKWAAPFYGPEIDPNNPNDEQIVYHPAVKTSGYAFLYEGKNHGFLGTQDRAENREMFEGLTFAWSAAGHGNVSYIIRAGQGGFVMVPVWASSSDAAEIRQTVILIVGVVISFVLPAAGIAIGNAIGAAVVGPSIAAAYPALATAIGNVAIATVMNGGDLESAVKFAALAYVGGAAGQFASQGAIAISDVPLLGKLAGSATAAAVQGRDIDKAVASTLLSSGAEIYDVFAGDKMDFTFPQGGGFELDPAGFGGDTGFDPGAYSFEPSLATPFAWGESDPFTFGGFGAFDATEPAGYAVPVVAAPEAPIQAADPFTLSDTREIVATVTDAARQALALVGAYRALDRPPINPVARAPTAAGSPVVALDSGVIQQRDAAGRVVNSRPAIGAPQSTVSGNLIVNNGDGTYTLISPNGQRRVISYGANSGADPGDLSALPWPVLIGAGGLLIALFKK